MKHVAIFSVSFVIYGIVMLCIHEYVNQRIAEIIFLISLVILGIIVGLLCKKKTEDQEKHAKIIAQLKENIISCERGISDLYFSKSPVAVIEWDANYIVRSANDKAREIFCVTEDSCIIGRHVTEFVPKKYYQKAIDVMSSVMSLGDGRRDIFKNVTCAGREIYCEWYNVPVSDTVGGTLIYSLVQDVTDHMKVEIELREKKQKLDGIMNALQDILYVVDINGTIEYANPFAYNTLNIPTEEAGRIHIADVLDKNEQSIAQRRIQKMICGGESLPQQEYHLKVRGDDEKRVKIVVNDVPFIEDGQHKILGLARLISQEQEELAKERIRIQRMQSISTLASGVAHDFNNLLMVISGNAYLLMNVKEADLEKYCHHIITAAERATGLTQQLSSLAKGGTSAREAAFITQIVTDTANIIGTSTQSRCHIDIADDIKPCMLDVKKIGQVFQNLFINASHAMPGGGMIYVTGENVVLFEDNQFLLTPGEYVYVMVQDSGTGIPEKYLSRIFEPYFTTKSVGEGSGLGLYVVYTIIAEHGGHIRVNSKSGKGTTFHIYLPSVSPEIALKQHNDQMDVLDEKTYKILVVEDMRDNRDILVEMLDVMGHSCHAVADGSEALLAYEDAVKSGKPFDLVITDLTIPGPVMGGAELIDALKKMDKQIVVIISSGYAEYVPQDVAGSLPKPFSMQKLRTMIQKVMQNKP